MLLDSSKKDVSSSDAHIRVTSSPLFAKRLENVTTRLKKIEQANHDGNWNLFCMLAIEEFEEMHVLFETSQPPFSYRNEHTLLALKQLEKINSDLKDKLLITMDAGNNIHVMTLKQNRQDLENLQIVFPGVRFVNSWGTQEGTRV
jgi:diphosphomevalonate decarboxylase